jgi:hypothetical protein
MAVSTNLLEAGGSKTAFAHEETKSPTNLTAAPDHPPGGYDEFDFHFAPGCRGLAQSAADHGEMLVLNAKRRDRKRH